MNIGVILSAGDSKRFGGYMNKQYLKLNGTEVVAYSIKAMRACKAIDEVLLVADREEYESRYIAEKYKVRCIVGGETRNRSIYNALCFIRENYSCENVVFHDSVRPLIPAKNSTRFLKICRITTPLLPLLRSTTHWWIHILP